MVREVELALGPSASDMDLRVKCEGTAQEEEGRMWVENSCEFVEFARKEVPAPSTLLALLLDGCESFDTVKISSVLQCCVVRSNALQGVARCCGVLQGVAGRCRALQGVAGSCRALPLRLLDGCGLLAVKYKSAAGRCRAHGVTTISRLLQITSLFCRIQSLL